MRDFLVILFLGLVIVGGCASVKYKEYAQGGFSVQYPDWKQSGDGLVSVQQKDCQVKVNIQKEGFEASDLQNVVDSTLVPAYQSKGLTVIPSVSGGIATFDLSGPAIGKAKFVVCNNNLYEVSAACTKNNEIVDQVINSVKCS